MVLVLKYKIIFKIKTTRIFSLKDCNYFKNFRVTNNKLFVLYILSIFFQNNPFYLPSVMVLCMSIYCIFNKHLFVVLYAFIICKNIC